MDYLGGLFSFAPGSVDPDHLILVVFSALMVLILDLGQRITGDHSVVLRWSPPVRGAAIGVLLLSVLMWSGGDAQPFIYFQF
jgi:hypothetical protein